MQQTEKIFDIIINDDIFYKNITKQIRILFEEAKKDLYVTETNIREKSLCTSSLRLKWTMIMLKEQANLNKIKEQKKLYINKKKEQLINMPEYVHKSAIQIDRELGESDRVKKINNLINENQTLIAFLQQITNIFQDFGFTVKNSIDSLKLS